MHRNDCLSDLQMEMQEPRLPCSRGELIAITHGSYSVLFGCLVVLLQQNLETIYFTLEATPRFHSGSNYSLPTSNSLHTESR